AVFAPFFGNRAATITAPAAFAGINNSPVVVARQTRLPGGKGYELEVVRLPASYPCGDAVADATLINQYLETAIRHAPEQYLWMHKRFKTQPGGKPESPYINIRSPLVKLNQERYEKLMSGRLCETDPDADQTYLSMESG